MKTVFWLSFALVAYSYVVYPLLMLRLGRVLGNNGNSTSIYLPSVAVLVSAHNEQRHITGRIENILRQDYPSDRLRIYIGSDGSTDQTVPLAKKFDDPRVHVLAFEQRRGKASVVNDLVAMSSEEILVFTDANTEFDNDAIQELVRPFADSSIGAVSGELRLRDPVSGDNCDSTYWRFETAIKRAESAVGGILGANGGIYAIRRTIFTPLPADTIIDDFTIVMNVSAQGYKAIFNDAAVAHEDVPEGMEAEFHRRVRIGIGNYQAFFRHPEYWQHASWSRRFTYLSHKVIRWFTPHLLIVALLMSFLLRSQSYFGVLFYFQLVVYALLTTGLLIKSRIDFPKILNIALFVFTLNAAFAVAFGRYITGRASGQWRRTER